jgi:hypothetical protein
MSTRPNTPRPKGKAVADENPDRIPMEDEDIDTSPQAAEQANKAMKKKLRDEGPARHGATARTLRSPPD